MTQHKDEARADRAEELARRIMGMMGYEPLDWQSMEEHVAALLRPHMGAERWIPVGERLPEPDQNVLACANGMVDIASYRPDSKMYRWDFDEYGCEEHEVTHWRPLPSAPDAEEKV